MKFLLFLLAILVTSLSYSQETIPSPLKRKYKVKYPPYNAITGKDRLVSLPPVTIGDPSPDAKYLQTLPNGNRVYALPQDNMPCVVPNESLTLTMPNLSGTLPVPYEYKGPGAIPNPAKPIQINPRKLNQKK